MTLDLPYTTPNGDDCWIRYRYTFERSEATHEVPAFIDFDVQDIEVTYPDGTTVPDEELEGIDLTELLYEHLI